MIVGSMGKKLAIKGHPTRGKEVIELLEMMGGVNADLHKGNFPDEWKSSYYIYRDNTIQFARDEFLLKLNFVIFTLEEFLEKYPYKVGDVIKFPNDMAEEIDEMKWVEELEDIIYTSVSGCTRPCYLPKNTNKTNMYMNENKVESTGFMQLGKTMAVIFNSANYEDEVELQLGDYEIEVRDGKTYAVLKKPKYPTTYEECCKILDIREEKNYTQGYKCGLFCKFQELFIARNAYWKIAGEQMGLGKPWDPDWLDEKTKYTIKAYQNRIIQDKVLRTNCILVFPTEEMRDAFYENFKDLIEQCKELL